MRISDWSSDVCSSDLTVAAHVVAGTVNQTGSLIVRADRIGRDTMLARIVQMVAAAQRPRAPIQRMADKVAGWFVPAVLGTALLSFAIWGFWAPEPRYPHGLLAAVAGLIIPCPLRVGPATPRSSMDGLGRVAGLGVRLKISQGSEDR